MIASAFPRPFGRYTLTRKLALGGMAELFIAKEQDADGNVRDVVVKRILPTYCEDETFVKMFIDEAMLTSKLQHPNIVQIFDFDVIDGQYFIAMEYIQGEDLQNLIKDGFDAGTPLSIAQCVWIVVELGKALHYAHTRHYRGKPLSIIHRDVTPHNAMVAYDGSVKLMDFGIAKADERSTKTQAGMVKGKVAYMSPEQARGKVLDPRSDLFALATVLWEMLTGRRLFLRVSDFETLSAILKEAADPPSTYRPEVDRELDQIILKALAKERDDRHPTVEAFARELNRWYFTHAPAPGVATARPFMERMYAHKIAALAGPAALAALPLSPNEEGTRQMDVSAPAQPAAAPSLAEEGTRQMDVALSPSLPPRGPALPEEGTRQMDVFAAPPALSNAETLLENENLSRELLERALAQSRPAPTLRSDMTVATPAFVDPPVAHAAHPTSTALSPKLLAVWVLVALGLGGGLAFLLASN